MTAADRAVTAPTANRTKMALQMLLGAICGAGAMILAVRLVRDPGTPRLAIDEIVTLGVGVVYGLMGLFVGLGALFPKPGARLLNVEDEDELRDQRRMLGLSALGCLLIGLSAVALVVASPGIAMLPASTGAMLFAASLIGAVAAGVASRRLIDEFGHRLSSEGNAAFLTLLMLVFASWAAMAHLGLAPMFSALAFYGGSLALYLLAMFWAIGRRGLLTPRG